MNKLCLDNDVTIWFDNHHIFVKDLKSNEEVVVDNNKNGLYQLELNDRIIKKNSTINSHESSLSWNLA